MSLYRTDKLFVQQWFNFCSRVFLAKQFEQLMPHLEALIPEKKRNFLTQFYSQVCLNDSCSLEGPYVHYLLCIDCESLS